MMADSKVLVVRCKTKSGQHVIRSLKSDSTVDDLCHQISEYTGLNKDTVKILRGYPPKLLDLSSGGIHLCDVPISSGDTLIVEEVVEPAPLVRENVSDFRQYDNTSADVPGLLMRKVVAADNSCLFTSVHYVMTNGVLDASIAKEMRKIIAGTVAANSVMFNEAYLGKSNEDYCAWIQNDDTWGGGIELSILSKHYQMEIVVVDTQNVRLNRFGEDFNYSNRVLLIYDGIHYDPLHMEMLDGTDTVQTMFPCVDQVILHMALELGKEAKQSRQFTDVMNFSLRCLVCNKPLKGQVEAQQHAKITGHTNFGEV